MGVSQGVLRDRLFLQDSCRQRSQLGEVRPLCARPAACLSPGTEKVVCAAGHSALVRVGARERVALRG